VAQEAGISSAAASEILEAVLDAVAGWSADARALGIGKRRREEIEAVLTAQRVALS